MKLALMLLALAAFTTIPASAKDKKPVDPDKKVCRSVDTTGSILGGRRVCRTYREWQEIDRAAASDTQHFQDTANRPINGGS